MAMRGIDVVVHAAALKIVPSEQPFECIRTKCNELKMLLKPPL